MSQKLSSVSKVCHVTSAHPRYDVRIFHKECRSLANNGFDVTLIVNDSIADEQIDGIKIISTTLEPKNRYERMITSKKKIRQLMLSVDADIYHFHDPELLPEATWIKKHRKKVIFDLHEDVSQQILFKTWIPRVLRKTVSRIYRWYEGRYIKRYDALVSVTPKFVERLKKINAKTYMITNYPLLNKDMVTRNIPKRRAICFAGGISSQWNHEKIIRAIETLDDVKYILAGSGTMEYIDHLKSLGGWEKVEYLGRIPHDEVKNIYEQAMIGMTLLSNHTQVGDEGTLGNTKIFEFMEAGLPVICSNNKLWKKIVVENQCGYSIDPEDVTEIRSSISEILDDPEAAARMGERGKEAIYKEFNWLSQEKVLLNTYRSLK